MLGGRGFVLVVLVVLKHLSHFLSGDASFLPASGSVSLQHGNTLRVGAEGDGLVVCIVHWEKCREHDAFIHDYMHDSNIVAAEGRGLLAGKCFRIGHMGYVTAKDIDAVLEALQQALPRLGFQPTGVR